MPAVMPAPWLAAAAATVIAAAARLREARRHIAALLGRLCLPGQAAFLLRGLALDNPFRPSRAARSEPVARVAGGAAATASPCRAALPAAVSAPSCRIVVARAGRIAPASPLQHGAGPRTSVAGGPNRIRVTRLRPDSAPGPCGRPGRARPSREGVAAPSPAVAGRRRCRQRPARLAAKTLVV